jgi:PAS domain S-box-containing protein
MNAAHHRKLRSEQALSLQGDAPDFYAFAESNPSAILVTNAKGEIQYVNAAWQRLTGYSRGEVVGKNPRFLNSGKTSTGLHKKLWARLAKGKSFESEEFVDRRKDGSEYSLHAVFFPVQLRKDTTYFVQVLEDISHKKEVEKLKDSFMGVAVHEMRNPLSTIVFSLELLKHELGSVPKAAKETLGTLFSEMDRFKSLIAYLLDVNKIHTDALNIHRKRKNLAHLVERVVAEMQPIFSSHTMIVENKSPHPFALFDEERIAQVLINLISNAVNYSPEADRVIIRLSEEENALKVSVQDFGIGIPKKEQSKIFEMLYRVKNKSSVQGAGFGLYISAQILAAHDTHLSVESEERRGSTFHFSLPLVR